MKDNFDKYNYFTLLSVFAKTMVEVFIPIYLYKIGFELEYVFAYFLILLTVSAIICVPLSYVGNKIKYKWLILTSSFFFALTYLILFNISIEVSSLWLLAIACAMYKRCYWIGSRLYALKVIPKRNMANKVSVVVVVTQIATIFASYIGALLLNNIPNSYLIIIATTLFALSTIPLMMIDEPEKEEMIKISDNVLKQGSKFNHLSMVLYEFKYISTFIFPIYLYLYVHTNFEYVGIFNIFVGLSSVIFIYLFSLKMDKDKYDYILISGLALAATLFLKLNCTITLLVLLIGLFEGIFTKMYDVGYTRNIYFLGSHYNQASYNMIYEVIQNFSRLFLFSIIFLFTRDLTTILYICIAGIVLSSLIKFDDGKGGYK